MDADGTKPGARGCSYCRHTWLPAEYLEPCPNCGRGGWANMRKVRAPAVPGRFDSALCDGCGGYRSEHIGEPGNVGFSSGNADYCSGFVPRSPRDGATCDVCADSPTFDQADAYSPPHDTADETVDCEVCGDDTDTRFRPDGAWLCRAHWNP
jgi:hypothetical protein